MKSPRRYGRLWIMLALVACIVAGRPPCARAITIRNDTPDSEYVDLSLQPQYDAIGWLRITRDRDYLCTATLISPTWILTAAHCIVRDDLVSRMLYTDSENRVHTVKQWFTNEHWTNNLVNGWDLALVELDEPITDIKPALLYDRQDELGQIATMVGYGKTGDGLTGSIQPQLTRRAGQNIFDNFGGDSVLRIFSAQLVFSDFDPPPGTYAPNPLGSPIALPLEASIAPGDSGGGTFVDVDGRTYLAAVHSLLYDPTLRFDSTYGTRFASTRVSLFTDWIEQNTGIRAGAPMPEPAALGALASVALAFAGTRRRRQKYS